MNLKLLILVNLASIAHNHARMYTGQTSQHSTAFVLPCIKDSVRIERKDNLLKVKSNGGPGYLESLDSLSNSHYTFSFNNDWKPPVKDVKSKKNVKYTDLYLDNLQTLSTQNQVRNAQPIVQSLALQPQETVQLIQDPVPNTLDTKQKIQEIEAQTQETTQQSQETTPSSITEDKIEKIKHLDAHGIEYLQSFKGSINGDEQMERIAELEREVERLSCENKMLKRIANDFVHRFGDLAATLEEIDIQRNEILETAKKMDKSLGDVADIFPDDDEISSFEWLIER